MASASLVNYLGYRGQEIQGGREKYQAEGSLHQQRGCQSVSIQLGRLEQKVLLCVVVGKRVDVVLAEIWKSCKVHESLVYAILGWGGTTFGMCGAEKKSAAVSRAAFPRCTGSVCLGGQGPCSFVTPSGH